MTGRRDVLVDLSHTIRAGEVTYRGLPPPVISDYLTREASRSLYAEGTEFHIARIDMVANTGTYLDVPFHRYADGADLSRTPLELCVNLPGVVVRVDHRSRREIGLADVEAVEVTGMAVLVHTGWSQYWGTDAYGTDHPFLTRAAALSLRDRGSILVGIDAYNIDDTRTRSARPVHTVLLEAGILIVEHLRGLDQLPDRGFRFSAAPPKIQGAGSFPVRAFAEWEASSPGSR